MKLSKATDYALHTMFHLIKKESDKPIGVQQLAEYQDVSATYLSKILTKLVKAGMIESISGAQGGYKLKRNKQDVNFLDIIHAIEGTAPLFECDFHHHEGCLIQSEIKNAEEKMNQHLRETKLIDLVRKEQRLS